MRIWDWYNRVFENLKMWSRETLLIGPNLPGWLIASCWEKQDQSSAVKGHKLLVKRVHSAVCTYVCMTGQMSSYTVNLILYFSFCSDLMRYTKVRGEDIAVWTQTSTLPWQWCLNYSRFVNGWVLVMDDLHSAYQMSRRKQHHGGSADDQGSNVRGSPLIVGRLSFVIIT